MQDNQQVPVINLISNRALENLDAVEIASVVGGLANIEYDTKDGDYKEKEEFYKGGSTNPDFYDILEETFYDIKDYERRTSALYPNRALSINGDIVKNIYRWGDLNAHHGNSRRNWRDLYYYGKMQNSIRDEGSLFKEITATIDLLKQLADVAKIGENYSKTESDREYYRLLAEKLNTGIDLLQREPVTEDNV